jgi:PAS domain S-box-containing protein
MAMTKGAGAGASVPGVPSILDGQSHTVHFYEQDRALIAELVRLVGAALMNGDAAVIVATKAHRDALERELQAEDLDVARTASEGRYVAFDAEEMLSRFMIDGSPDAESFSAIMGPIIGRARAAAKNPESCLVIFGEMVSLLWAQGKWEAAIRLEELWNDLASSHSFSLRCAYPLKGFAEDEHREPFLRICGQHSGVVPEGGQALLLSDDERLRTIAQLQQRVQTLEHQKALHESEQRFRLLVEAVQDYAIFMLDVHGRVSSWNIGAERIKGYKASEILAEHFSRFYPEEDIRAEKPQRELEIAARDGRLEDEGWRLRKDGSPFWASVIITALRNSAGELVGFAKVTRDITERREAVRRLEEQAAILQLANDAIIVRDFDGIIRFWNHGAQDTYGWSAEEAVGKITHQLLRTEFPVPLEDINRTVLETGRWGGELVHYRQDGSRMVVTSQWAMRTNSDGSPDVILEINRDITLLRAEMSERIEAQKKLNVSERSLRELSLHLLRTQDEERRRIGRDLHDSLGQYLSVLKMKLDSLTARAARKRTGDLPELQECAQLMEDSIKEVRTISYLLYPPMLEEMGLKSAIPWYLDGFTKRSNIKTTFEVSPEFGRLSPEVELALFRVIQESLTNVHRHSGSPSASVKLIRNDGAIVLQVSDKGKGTQFQGLEAIGPDWMGALGVGLRGMSERMRQIGGKFELSSTPQGTTVTAIVPLQNSSAGSHTPA